MSEYTDDDQGSDVKWTMLDAALDLCRVEADRYDEEAMGFDGEPGSHGEMAGYNRGIARIYRWIAARLQEQAEMPGDETDGEEWKQ